MLLDRTVLAEATLLGTSGQRTGRATDLPCMFSHSRLPNDIAFYEELCGRFVLRTALLVPLCWSLSILTQHSPELHIASSWSGQSMSGSERDVPLSSPSCDEMHFSGERRPRTTSNPNTFLISFLQAFRSPGHKVLSTKESYDLPHKHEYM